MLAQIRRLRRPIAAALLLAAAGTMISCASQKQTALVSDPDAKPENAMPWNKQEKWESGGSQFANMTDHR